MKAFPWREQLIQLDDLTPAQLEQGAADLRNAAYVVDTLGHTKGLMLDYETGAVCATGAIDVATDKRRLTSRTRLRPLSDGSNTYFALVFQGDTANPRREYIAYTLLADFLPTELCSDCDYNAVCNCPGSHYPHAKPDVSTWKRVVHYNDAHCTSGELLSNMLVIAAERAEMLAADARKMLTGKVLV